VLKEERAWQHVRTLGVHCFGRERLKLPVFIFLSHPPTFSSPLAHPHAPTPLIPCPPTCLSVLPKFYLCPNASCGLVGFGHIVTLIAVWRLTRLRRQSKRTSGEGKGPFTVILPPRRHTNLKLKRVKVIDRVASCTIQ
jgi:hypothetical protein